MIIREINGEKYMYLNDVKLLIKQFGRILYYDEPKQLKLDNLLIECCLTEELRK